jgi:hypothetical protein
MILVAHVAVAEVLLQASKRIVTRLTASDRVLRAPEKQRVQCSTAGQAVM